MICFVCLAPKLSPDMHGTPAPTVLDFKDIPTYAESAVAKEETFGPLLSIIRFELEVGSGSPNWGSGLSHPAQAAPKGKRETVGVSVGHPAPSPPGTDFLSLCDHSRGAPLPHGPQKVRILPGLGPSQQIPPK